MGDSYIGGAAGIVGGGAVGALLGSTVVAVVTGEYPGIGFNPFGGPETAVGAGKLIGGLVGAKMGYDRMS